ncbi:MAG: hypothetical protein R6V45_05500 [Oceanipulchritudo sp.]
MNDRPEDNSRPGSQEVRAAKHKRIIIACMALFIVLPLALAALRLLGYL